MGKNLAPYLFVYIPVPYFDFDPILDPNHYQFTQNECKGVD